MKKYLFFFILSLSILIIHAVYTKHAIYGDGNGYYATSQSLLYEGQLNSPTFIHHLKNFEGRDYVFSRVFWNENINPYPLGPSLAWIPALSLTSIFSSDRFDLFHELAPGITGIIFMLGGLYLLQKYLLAYYSPRVVELTIVSIFLGSNVFYYSSFEPSLSHQPAFFIIALLLYLTQNFSYSKTSLVFLGLLFGFLPVTRLADTVLLIPLFFLFQFDLKRLLYFVFGFLIGVSPQLYAQYFYYGTIFRNFYVTEMSHAWSLDLTHVYEYFFSLKRGLFTWSPLFLLGLTGLIRLNKKLILSTLTLFWIIGSFWSAYSSAGFGQRLSLSAIPFFALGIAYSYDKLAHKYRYLLALLFILWNLFLLYGFYILSWKDLP